MAAILADFDVYVKKQKALEPLMTADFAELCDAIGADKFQVVNHKSGNMYFQIIDSTTGDYFTIKLGDKVDGLPKGDKMIPYLVDNFTIYAGVSKGVDKDGNPEERPWMTFGTEPGSNEPVASMDSKTLAKHIGRKVTESKP